MKRATSRSANVEPKQAEVTDLPASTDVQGGLGQSALLPQVQAVEARIEDELRPRLAVLVYLCGDNHIQANTDEYLKTIVDATPLKHVHILIQHDKPDEARRFVLRAGANYRLDRQGPAPTHQVPSAAEPEDVEDSANTETDEIRRDINSGSPEALAAFLEWALNEPDVQADHYVLLFSGLGINPRYVRQSLPLSDLPKGLHKARGGKPDDPNDPRVTKEFLAAFKKLDQADKSQYRQAIQSRTFTICHDFSDSGSLQVSDMRDVLAESTRWFPEGRSDARFDLILCHTGATAFVEVLFELEGLAQIFMGSADRLPNEGLPFDDIFRHWDQLLGSQELTSSSRNGRREAMSKLLAHSCQQTLSTAAAHRIYRNSKPRAIQQSLNKIVAVNIDALDELARSLDALAVALLHSLGDWHVKDALEKVQRNCRLKSISADEPGSSTIESRELEDIEFLPVVDLFDWLDNLERQFNRKLGSPNASDAAGAGPNEVVPAAHGQRERIRKLYKLIRKTIAHLRSSKLSSSRSLPGGLFVDRKGAASRFSGLLVLMPPQRTSQEIEEEKRIYSIASPSYTQLNFSRRVHWSALIGCIQMIREKPHTLWRVISSMLVDANSPARDAVLSRLISRQSVISQMRGQFRSLGESESLTMSFDPNENTSPDSDLTRFQVRLEPSLGGNVIYQHESRIYRSTLDSIWRNLATLINQCEPHQQLVNKLRALGASLGEDVIQDLVGALEQARQSMVDERNETPHLTLQLPREFMRFPWELMNDREGLLSERYALGRQVFMESRFVRAVARHQANNIRVLIIGDPLPSNDFALSGANRRWVPATLLGAQVEARTIEETFRRLNDEMAGVVEFDVKTKIGETLLRDDLRSELRDGGYDIIHFAGHALNNSVDGDGSGWVVSDGLLHAREIRNTLSWAKRPPWLIFANACEAGMDLGTSQSPTDVSGLATACINQGVAAYIAPLWPVDDEIARWLAVGFYRELLRERFSIGESLRRARLAIWSGLQESGRAVVMPAKTALTWASFVLYGDPTARLLNTLWSPASKDRLEPPPEPQRRRKRASVQSSSARFRTATVGQLRNTVSFPSALMAGPAVPHLSADRAVQSGDLPANSGEFNSRSRELELVEREGLRFWRVRDPAHPEVAKTLSSLGRLLHDDQDVDSKRVRRELGGRVGQERGVMDAVNVISRWELKPISGAPTEALVRGMVSDFDRQVVPDERLVRYVTHKDRRVVLKDNESQPIWVDLNQRVDDQEWLTRRVGSGQHHRAVLLLHGTYANCGSSIEDFATSVDSLDAPGTPEDESLLNWMLRRYSAVLAYDHWTLSKSPEQNAASLAKLLTGLRLRSNSRKKLELDLVCHGRGGLVARALIELVRPKDVNFHRVVFVGTPQAGTSMADPTNWASMADLLINQVSLDPSGQLGRLSGLMAYMCAQGIQGKVPGLRDLCPLETTSRTSKTADEVAEPGLFDKLSKQRRAVDWARYFVVAANFTPTRDALTLQTLLTEVGLPNDDRLLPAFSDLMVDTASMWSFHQSPSWSQPPNHLPPDNVLLFNTERSGPKGIKSIQRAGVHHLNYFLHPLVRQFIRRTLDC